MIGNISVGGTGKTPVVVAIAEWLLARGLNPAIISRGYGGQAPQYPLYVTPDTPVEHCGDEAKLLLERGRCPVVVDPKRVNAWQWLVDQAPSVDVIISDDGLQHYDLPRAAEVVVIDGERQLGNQRCLPVGPLREPVERLDSVDFVLQNGGQALFDCASAASMFRLYPSAWVNLSSGERTPLESFDKALNYCAIAGIGNPTRFFTTLTELGIRYESRAFPDHYAYSEADFANMNSDAVLMTEKDAVKCLSFAKDSWWYLEVNAKLPSDFLNWLESFVAEPVLDLDK